jgi:hypothetical protein
MLQMIRRNVKRWQERFVFRVSHQFYQLNKSVIIIIIIIIRCNMSPGPFRLRTNLPIFF